MKLDRIDCRILEILQKDASISNLDLADRVGLSATPCARRVKQLEDAGLIKGSVVLLDEKRLGLSLTAYIQISMDRHTADCFDQFERQISEFPEVVELSLITGQSADYLAKVVLADMDHFQSFLLGRLTKLEGVTGVQSSFVLRKPINHTALPVEQCLAD